MEVTTDTIDAQESPVHEVHLELTKRGAAVLGHLRGKGGRLEGLGEIHLIDRFFEPGDPIGCWWREKLVKHHGGGHHIRQDPEQQVHQLTLVGTMRELGVVRGTAGAGSWRTVNGSEAERANDRMNNRMAKAGVGIEGHVRKDA